MKLPTVAAAARNNAEWCATVCASHDGAELVRHRRLVAHRPLTDRSIPTRSPSNPMAPPVHLLPRIDSGPGCSIKDSFATLEPTARRVSYALRRRVDRAGHARGPPARRRVEPDHRCRRVAGVGNGMGRRRRAGRSVSRLRSSTDPTRRVPRRAARTARSSPARCFSYGADVVGVSEPSSPKTAISTRVDERRCARPRRYFPNVRDRRLRVGCRPRGRAATTASNARAVARLDHDGTRAWREIVAHRAAATMSSTTA